jgi:outer membrane protein OmpA-like peptidoglycan-associated protein
MLRTALALAAVALLASSPIARAVEGDAEECKDSPLVKRFPGSLIHDCSHKSFDEAEVPVGPGEDAPRTQRLEGEVTSVTYENPENASPLEIARNYENAIRKSGFTLVFNAKQGESRLVTARLQQGGKDAWLAFDVDETWTTLRVVQVKAMEQKVEVTADGLLAELQKSGRVAVYGINFATGKATLTPDSESVLREVQKLLADNADLRLRVEGHTDSVGKPKDNLDLSRKRAAAVKSWLAGRGIDGARLTTEGYGDTRPLADNATDEGKAKNRRVELAKLGPG